MATSSAAPAPVASSSAVHNQQPAPNRQSSIQAILEEIASHQDDTFVSQYLKNKSASREFRESTYASLMADGRDPLDILDPAIDTLLYMYILSMRLTVPNAAALPAGILQNFCENFNPEKARLAPDRVTVLAKAIVSFFEASNSLANSIPLLSALVSRYPPSPFHLTTLHTLFASTCVRTRNYAMLLSVLSEPIIEVDLSISDLHYNDNLIYHYAKGFAAVGLRRYEEAEECFEAVVASPAQTPAAIQLEALKKLVLVQLILYGKVKELPKYVNPSFVSLYKKTPYAAFAREYPIKQAVLEDIFEKGGEVFVSDKNVGLMRVALGRARRWAIRRLTETYISLSLAEIGNAVGLVDDVEAVRTIVQSMIDEGEIGASISSGDGTVTFTSTSIDSDFTPSDMEKLLQAVQTQNALLSSLNLQLERSKEFVGKAWKNSGNGPGSGSGPGGHGHGAGAGGIEMNMGDDAMGLDEDLSMKGQYDATWAEED